MISYFPEPYPDELFYSILCRYHVHTGALLYRATAETVFAERNAVPDLVFINPLRPEFRETLNHLYPGIDWVSDYTMYSCYGRFLDTERQTRGWEKLKAGNTDGRLQRPLPKYRKEMYLKYCPHCVREDRKQYGETYWHRVHQIPGIAVCPDHGVRLLETDISIFMQKNPEWRPAEMENLLTEDVRESADDRRKSLAEYMKSVFLSPLSSQDDVPIARFLHSRFQGTKYCSVRGKQRYMGRFVHDFCGYYGEASEIFQGQAAVRLEKIMTGKRWDFAEICMTGMFLGIPVEDLVRRKMTADSQVECFDETVRHLHEQGWSYPRIAKHLGASVHLVKPIGEGRYGDKGRKERKCRTDKTGRKARDWAALDDEYLGQVKELIDQLDEEGAQRPQRYGVRTIQKQLELPAKSLDKMPRCRDYIRSHMCSIEELWAKEICWALSDIRQRGEPINPKRIRTRINIRYCQMRECLPFLETMMNEEDFALIRSILE